ncbi:MAG: CPBP family intramembrane metalloprotease [Defluviitaleaceae bacterium]|nr:CPBP family intramembrane metalloprotease [Defluviitaleaceae bacterium]
MVEIMQYEKLHHILLLVFLISWYVAIPLIISARRRGVTLSGITSLQENQKDDFWIKNATTYWGITLALLIISLLLGISIYDIGFRSISLHQNTWVTTIALVLGGLYTIIILISMLVLKYNKDEPEVSLYSQTKKGRLTMLYTAATAGVCEEIIYRGFLFFLIQSIFSNIPTLLVLIVSSVIFGCVHVYQGASGIARTTVIGLIFGLLFLATDSLILPMFLHFLIDIAAITSLYERTV